MQHDRTLRWVTPAARACRTAATANEIRPHRPAVGWTRRTCRAGGPRDVAPDYLRIVITGLYDMARYPTPSHARQAVIASAVWAGMQPADVISWLHNGAWPGLASFYTRYRSVGARRKAVLPDWKNAVSWVQNSRQMTPA